LNINVNGQEREVRDGSSIADLLESLGLAAPQVAVEHNREIVPRARYTEQRLAEGDRLEVVTFVGGG